MDSKKSNFNSFNYVETCIELLYLRGNYVTLYVSSTITTSIPFFRIYPLHPEYYGVYLQEDMLIKRIFSSNQIVHKISFSLCFWAPDPLINKFY